MSGEERRVGQAHIWGEQAGVRARAGMNVRPTIAALLPWLALAGIMLGALALRLWAIEQRLPYTVNVDEPVVVDQASGILLSGDLNPHRFVYPSLQIYLQAIISWFHLQWGLANGLYRDLSDLPKNSHVITSAPGFYVWGRAGTAVLGALAVLFTGLAGRGLAGPRAGLVAALLLAVSPLHAGHSRFVTPDVPASCFTALALLGAVAIWRQSPTLGTGRRLLLYVLGGAAFGLATATKYNAVVIGACLLLAHVLARPPRAWLAAPDLWVAGAAALAAFFLVTPFALIDRETFLEDAGSVIHHYRTGHLGWESDQNWWWYLRWLLRNEPWLTIPALAGTVWAAVRHRGRDALLLIFPLASYAGLAAYRVHFERNLLPLFPFFALLAACLLVDAGNGLGRLAPRLRPAVGPATALAALLLALAPGRGAAETAAYLARPDSRVAAVAWLRANVPAGTLVVADLDPQLWEGEGHIHAARFISPLHEQPPEWFSGRGYRYVVTNESRYERYLHDRARYANEAAAYDRLFAEAAEVARFADAGGYVGPEVRVLRLEARATDLTMGGALPNTRLGPVEVLGATIAPVSRLEDIAVVRGNRQPSVRAGGIMGLTLFWRVTDMLDTDYTVFVHVVDAQGRTVAQRDTPPRGGAYPTTKWRVGEVVVDPANVPLPPTLAPGTYRVIVGLYRPADDKRLPAQPATPERPDSVEVGTVTVRRP